MDREVFQEKFRIIGKSVAFRQVIDKIGQVAPTDITVLLEGETGVGKDLAARAIHGVSARKDKNLVIVNCGAIPEGIIESELFGHEKGAFTGAHESREGYFEKANGGTIFLDEIGDTPKNVQVKLLRVLETGEFFRVGSSHLKRTDVRVITATNVDLWQSVLKGDFREDLYYRLDTVKIRIPPLRERSEDVIPIFENFVNEYAAKYDSIYQGFSEEARQLLVSYRWPGNIRELRNVAEQLVVLEKSQYITAEILQKYLKGRQHLGSADNLPVLFTPPDERADGNASNAQQGLIYRVLLELGNDMSDVKKMLGQFLYGLSDNNQHPHKALPAGMEVRSKTSAMEDFMDDNDLVHGRPGLFSEPEDVPANETDEFYQLFEKKGVPSLEDTERVLIQIALQKFDGNRRKASEALGISERTLYRKIDQYDLD